jgi:hypothetical protein
MSFSVNLSAAGLLLLAGLAGLRAAAHMYLGWDLSLSGYPRDAIAHLNWVKENSGHGTISSLLAASEISRIHHS